MKKQNKKDLKPIRNYTSEKNIEKWLLENYTFTDKHTFISGVQLFNEFNNENQMWDPIQLPFLDHYNLKPKKVLDYYLKFWINLNDVLKKLEWPVEQNFIVYTDDETDSVSESSDKIQGIFYLLKKKDINKNIIEAPKDRILDSFTRYSFRKQTINENIDSFDLFDFRQIEESTQTENIDKLIAGFPYSDEFIHHPWYSFPTIYRYWRGIISTEKKNINDK